MNADQPEQYESIFRKPFPDQPTTSTIRGRSSAWIRGLSRVWQYRDSDAYRDQSRVDRKRSWQHVGRTHYCALPHEQAAHHACLQFFRALSTYPPRASRRTDTRGQDNSRDRSGQRRIIRITFCTTAVESLGILRIEFYAFFQTRRQVRIGNKLTTECNGIGFTILQG